MVKRTRVNRASMPTQISFIEPAHPNSRRIITLDSSPRRIMYLVANFWGGFHNRGSIPRSSQPAVPQTTNRHSNRTSLNALETTPRIRLRP